jgi:hypothetical protein
MKTEQKAFETQDRLGNFLKEGDLVFHQIRENPKVYCHGIVKCTDGRRLKIKLSDHPSKNGEIIDVCFMSVVKIF